MRFFRTLKLVFFCFLFGYIGKLVGGRLFHLSTCYTDAVLIQKKYLEQNEACRTDKTYHVFSDTCTIAKRESGKRPFFVAFREMLHNTESCIEYPCSDILKEFMRSWVTIIVLAALIFFGILILLIWVYNKTKGVPFNYTQRREPMIYELNNSQPFLIKND